jgi:hypothetical protein
MQYGSIYEANALPVGKKVCESVKSEIKREIIHKLKMAVIAAALSAGLVFFLLQALHQASECQMSLMSSEWVNLAWMTIFALLNLIQYGTWIWWYRDMSTKTYSPAVWVGSGRGPLLLKSKDGSHVRIRGMEHSAGEWVVLSNREFFSIKISQHTGLSPTVLDLKFSFVSTAITHDVFSTALLKQELLKQINDGEAVRVDHVERAMLTLGFDESQFNINRGPLIECGSLGVINL